MGGHNNQQQNKKKSSSSPFAVFNFLKGKRGSQRKVVDPSSDDSFKYYKVWPSDEDKGKRGSQRKVVDPSSDDSFKYYKVWPSDEDRGRFVAKPGIDRDATAYIAKIYAAIDYNTGEHDRPY